jgi:hypothetical protein
MAQPRRNRGGRPPLAAARQRTHAVSVRFTAAEARALKRRAIARGCSVAALVREDLARAPGAVDVAAPAPTASAEAVARRVELRRVGRLLNDATHALHAARGRPGAQTLDALRQAAEAVVRQLGRWP